MLLDPCFLALYAGLALGVLGTVVALEAAQPYIGRVPPIPSVPRVRRAVLGALRRHWCSTPAGARVWELGSGWGGLALAIARDFPEAHVVGVECRTLPYWVSRARLILAHALGRCRNLSFIREDFRALELAPCAAAVGFLLPDVLRGLPGRLPKGCVLVSAVFPVPGLVPLDTHTGPTLRTYAYAYRIGSPLEQAAQPPVPV
ncbi:MAG TPA: hypothetical protein DDX54_06355 [Rhodospirillaceae bacterium]|jgi:hypothetical protein|nr:hypothetical protein [Alphaproteobacteria bacterium]HBH27006.1 hypothetical protein [Rhodospirillaceae bacterium]